MCLRVARVGADNYNRLDPPSHAAQCRAMTSASTGAAPLRPGLPRGQRSLFRQPSVPERDVLSGADNVRGTAGSGATGS